MTEKNIETILAVVDPTTALELGQQRAAQRALWLAKRLGATLELFVCDYNEQLSGKPFFDSRGLEKARNDYIGERASKLEAFARKLSRDGVRVTTNAAWDHPVYEGIVRKVLRSQPDLVVKDTRRHARLQRALFTFTDWHLLRMCPAPLLLTKTEDWPDAPNFVAAVDPMHAHDKPAALDHRILHLGEKLASALGGELHAVHAAPSAKRMNWSAPEPVSVVPEAQAAEGLEAHRGALASLLSSHALPPQHVHLEAGAIDDVLNGVVERVGAAAVIMGVIARNALSRVLLGSTAERVLDGLPCDVLAVKPEGFVCPVEP